MNRWLIIYFFIGMIWAWGLTAIFVVVMDFNSEVKREFTVEQFNSGIPNAINTVQTIPVEVYKLEREETK
tara:strand:+ start:455 stop:664 length:210 start_codon:yes stop_codon:yes gene_type:complete